MAVLTVVRGVPGSGKTTYAKKNFDCLILEQDMFHERNGVYQWNASAMPDAVDWCRRMTALSLARGMDVCVVNTFTKRKYVEDYRKLAETHGADFRVVRLAGDFENVHSVPPAILENMKRGFEDWSGETVVYP